MKHKIIALLCAAALIVCMTGCSKEEETTTMTAMVISVDGTVVTLRQLADRQMEMPENGEAPDMPAQGEEPSMPAGGEMPEKPADGEMPELPADGEKPTKPENGEETEAMGDVAPESIDGTAPLDIQQIPEGETPPELPDDENGDRKEGRGELHDQGESVTLDLANAHISVEIDGGKATGSMEDITVGSILTVTLNAAGEATNVLVSSMSGFDPMRSFQDAGSAEASE